MTYTASAPFGTGGAVLATVDNTVANFGASPFAASGRSETGTQTYLSDDLCILLQDTEPASNAGTT